MKARSLMLRYNQQDRAGSCNDTVVRGVFPGSENRHEGVERTGLADRAGHKVKLGNKAQVTEADRVNSYLSKGHESEQVS